MYKDLKSSAVLRQITVDTKKKCSVVNRKRSNKKAKPVKKNLKFL